MTFDALGSPQVEELVRSLGAPRWQDLMRRLEDEEVDSLMDLRPMDVELLVRQWTASGRLGSWSETLAAFLERAIVDVGAGRARQHGLPPRTQRQALLRIAAATTFMKTPYVSLPESMPLHGLVSSRRLFDDWELRQLLELFECGLFSLRGTDAVQLPQGAATSYFAARWLVERVRAGMPVSELRNLLFVDLPGIASQTLPQSRVAVAGWVASLLPEFRPVLLEHCARALLIEGDPECLTAQEVLDALRCVIDEIARHSRLEWPTRATIRKLARKELSTDIYELLNHHQHSPAAVLQLLEFGLIGRYSEFVPLALEWALSDARHPQVRAECIRIVHSLGTDEQTGQLSVLLSERDPDIRRELLQALAPTHLAGNGLLSFLQGGNESEFELPGLVLRIVPRLAISDLDDLLVRIFTLIDTEELDDDSTRAASIATTLAVARLQAAAGIEQAVIDVLRAAEFLCLSGAHAALGGQSDELDHLVGDDTERRRAMWVARVHRDAPGRAVLHITSPVFADVRPQDLTWVAERTVEADVNEQVRDRWDFLANRILSMFTNEELAARRETEPGLLKQRIERVLVGRAVVRQQTEDREAQALAERTARQNDLLSRRESIRAGTDTQALLRVWESVGIGLSRERLDLATLRQEVGDAVAEDVRAGFIAAWRRQAVEVPSPGQSPMLGPIMIGLTGISLELQDGLDLSGLSPEHANLAARLALSELNGFPAWAEELLRSQREMICRVFEAAVAAEWSTPREHHGVLSRASYCAPAIATELRSIALKLLDQAPPASTQTLHYAVAALQTSTSHAPRIRQLILRELDRAHDGAQIEWLRALAHFAPQECALRLRSLPRDTALRVVALVYADLDENRHSAPDSALLTPENLEVWVQLLLDIQPPESDPQHQGAYSPSIHDDAADLRRLCITRLSNNPTPAAAAALGRLAQAPTSDTQLRAWFLSLQRDQSLRAAEELAAPWNEAQVLAVEHGDERPPSRLFDLFALVVRHLLHVGSLVENDDFSYRRIFATGTQEREIQYWVASCLRERSRRLYSVVRENVVEDDKEVDITAIAPGAGQVPIEIKPLGRYSASALERTLKEQLLGRYMQPRDRTYGVLLLVRLDHKEWRLGTRQIDLTELCSHLQEQADALGALHGKVLRVISIDLLH